MARPGAGPAHPGQFRRTAALHRWGERPTRLAQRLEQEGRVQGLGHGFLYVPRAPRFGAAPPSEDALLDGTPYLVTGPPRWNALGLGSTALHLHPLVDDTKRTGAFALGGRTFARRRVALPRVVTAAWFAVDLLRNADSVGLDRADRVHQLGAALTRGRFDGTKLLDLALPFGTRADRDLVRQAVRAASS